MDELGALIRASCLSVMAPRAARPVVALEGGDDVLFLVDWALSSCEAAIGGPPPLFPIQRRSATLADVPDARDSGLDGIRQ